MEPYTIKTFTIAASHIRGYSTGLRDDQDGHLLRLHVKQYIPNSSSYDPQPGDPTLIIVHGIGSSKESYEPLIADLLSSDLRVRSIWTFDSATHGASYRLNAPLLGRAPSWLDAARDLLHLANTFAAAMPPPLLALGQSWGCAVALLACTLHPRLFAAVVACEPFLATGPQGSTGPEKAHASRHRVEWMARRRARWPSRAAARRDLAAMPYYASMDARVFARVVEFDLWPVGEAGEAEGAVELTTPPAQQVVTMLRVGDASVGVVAAAAAYVTPIETLRPGTYDPDTVGLRLFLPQVQPRVLYVWGKESDVARIPGYIEAVVAATGTSRGGKGTADQIWIDRARHHVTLERPADVARGIAPWIEKVREEYLARRERILRLNSIALL